MGLEHSQGKWIYWLYPKVLMCCIFNKSGPPTLQKVPLANLVHKKRGFKFAKIKIGMPRKCGDLAPGVLFVARII